MDHLKHAGLVIYLKATFATVCERLGDLSTRPLFQDPSQAARLYTERAPVYASFADITIDTDGLSTNLITQQISAIVEERR
jgi:shikimate kinase